MRFWTAAVALFASLALAQQNAISIPGGQSTLEITAGEPTTIEWTNPSSGTVTIKLQQNDNHITPESGIVLASAIPASAGTATFTIDPSDVNLNTYTIEIIDDTNPSNINFSPAFAISGAASTSTGTASSATDSTATSTATDSTATDSTATTTATDSSSSASETETSTTSKESSSTTTSAEATESTSAPSSGDAAGLRVQGGLVAAVAVAVAVL